MLSNPHWCLGSWSKERQYFSLLLGNLCTTIQYPPPSVFSEAGRSTNAGTEVWLAGSERSLLSLSWYIWLFPMLTPPSAPIPTASEALTPWHALRHGDQCVKGRPGLGKALRVKRRGEMESSQMVPSHQWSVVVHISVCLCTHRTPRPTSFNSAIRDSRASSWSYRRNDWSLIGNRLVLSRVGRRLLLFGVFIYKGRFNDNLLFKAIFISVPVRSTLPSSLVCSDHVSVLASCNPSFWQVG